MALRGNVRLPFIPPEDNPNVLQTTQRLQKYDLPNSVSSTVQDIWNSIPSIKISILFQSIKLFLFERLMEDF